MKSSALPLLLLSLPALAAPHPDWTVEPLVDDVIVGSYHSLTVDVAGSPLASFVDIGARQLKLVRLSGGSWQREIIDPGDGVNLLGNYNTLALAPDGQPAIAYRGRTGDLLQYAKFNGSTWSIASIPGSTTNPNWTSLAFSPAGQPAIGFKANSLLAYASYDGSSWSVTPDVDSLTVTGDNASLAFGPDGKPAMAAYRGTGSQVRFVAYGTSSWGAVSNAAILSLNAPADPSLAFSPAGNPAIAYRDLGAGKLKYAERMFGSWFIEDVDDLPVSGLSECCELAFHPLTGAPAIAYTDPSNKDLKFAIKTESGWQITLVDPDGDTGRYPKLAFAADGSIAIAYLLFNEGSDSDLMLARFIVPIPVPAPTIATEARHAWMPNAGWVSLKETVEGEDYGVAVSEFFLSGEAYAPNFGWIYFGNGTPADGKFYANDSETDYGVNRTADGKLFGRAWAPNIGWIHFEESKGDARLNLLTGQFTGYAWAPNVGWLDLSTVATSSIAYLDADGDGISDDWERANFGNINTANATSNSDGDSASDLAEFQSDTDPTDADSWLRILSHSTLGDRTETTIEFTSSLGRIHQLQSSLDLVDWDDDLENGEFLGTGTPMTRSLSHPAESKLFFRVGAKLPLSGD